MIKGTVLNALGAAVLGASLAMPLGQQHTPRFRPPVAYDGDGRKIKPKQHPDHNARQRTAAWRDYARRVESTHSVDRFGNRQIDPRDDKYLHAHARGMRGLVRALEARGR